ncbi:uncharacterized protein YukE [Allocatelliglobosispora scoriae]|uniref:Uncharacterized protein YukE n=1 Tax=Allocatelliglobosispora scoriae TaxID=643052 RepID=A0A841BPZ8_9ACTN|nr:M91 family zinc metallopeptidase [Allocatelliglobosispora scoriae]MBB5869765.1 uncharacterized protein YukE [Allocatelliglobosispora scoriae]
MTRELIVADVWRLEHDWSELGRAGTLWQTILRRADERLRSWDAQARATVPGSWSGSAASAYAAHRKRVAADLAAAQQLADHVGAAVRATAESMRAADTELAGQLRKLCVTVALDERREPGRVVFLPADAAQAALVRAAVAAAGRTRKELSERLTGHAETVRRTLPRWQQIGDAWRGVAEGGDPFLLPGESSQTLVLRDGHRVVIATGAGNDDVRVFIDEAGQRVVDVNGGRWLLAADAEVTIRTGDGDDSVVVAPGSAVRLTVLGGDGRDLLVGGDGTERLLGLGGDDRILAGGGADVVSGGAGNDYVDAGAADDIVDGGWGDDTLYGLAGGDHLAGGDGRDFVEGGTGRDAVDGGAGNDIVSGGTDDDRITGRGGADVLYSGAGSDTVDGGAGRDIAHLTSAGPVTGVEQQVTVELRNVGTEVRVEGSPEFVERVQADLDLLRTSPVGQQMLAGLDAGVANGPVDHLTIIEFATDNGRATSDGVVAYNPAFNTLLGGTPPVGVLYHELAHQWDFTHGTADLGTYHNPADPDRFVGPDGQWHETTNLERVAVGLPIDDDNDPRTPMRLDPDHPFDLTENGLRAEMGLNQRRKYAV